MGFLGHKLSWKSTAHPSSLPPSQQSSVLQGRAPLTLFSADSCKADSRALPVQTSSNQGGSEPENSESWRWVNLTVTTLECLFVTVKVINIHNYICFCLSQCFFSFLDSDMPDHDLEPPRFAQLALERVLQDWNALKSMIMFGSQENKDPYVFTRNSLDLCIWHVSLGNHSASSSVFPSTLKSQCQQ